MYTQAHIHVAVSELLPPLSKWGSKLGEPHTPVHVTAEVLSSFQLLLGVPITHYWGFTIFSWDWGLPHSHGSREPGPLSTGSQSCG